MECKGCGAEVKPGEICEYCGKLCEAEKQQTAAQTVYINTSSAPQMRCARCKEALPRGAVKCPKCGKYNTVFLVVLCIVGITFLYIISVAMSMAFPDHEPEYTEQNIIIDENFAVDDNDWEIIINDAEEEPMTVNAGVGEQAEIGDFAVTLNGMDSSDGYSVFTPENGKKYYGFRFTVENSSDEKKNVSFTNMECYIDDKKVSMSSTAFTVFSQSNDVYMSGSIAAGKKLELLYAIEYDADWQTAELHFKPDIFTDNKIIFTLNK